ncbi:MAG: nucleotidyl transferase AbiEii/AbiGii toxin family protein [Chlamydiae bacterium]|nr:nucleotidyl transferase AbiEii/AbiGii toxin family protein [Chlamydiota bacterium]MBI3266219.1 nucleotidyl transferase AbiEii/AbiGii toxin family protein [Chlamydiota bacterium]
MKKMPEEPSRQDILSLAKWILKCPLIRKNYALSGGTWLTLRLPQHARNSKDVDILSPKEEISSYKAMLELVKQCNLEKVKYRITRRGEHFCQLYIRYPKLETKVDIGKIWRPVTLLYEPELRCPILSEKDMILEKLYCVVDRIEPTDIYDLCLLHASYPSEFRKALENLSESLEVRELLIQMNGCFEMTKGIGTKEVLSQKQTSWMNLYLPQVIKDVSIASK